ncbi:Ring/U-Box superfamily protein [Striga hermonthica]|uniref:Ring/U-Box superfamily protein n=1 Tax=Striga hermonthica TaxID=68872 RepID=A0A9N7NNV1_STRHE|nr:Ring/U-Box superfamily protein [Striga hermonthica]
MAVAGLHNVSPFGPSLFGESHVSERSTRASSLLQMWRELEGDHEVTRSPRSTRLRNDSELGLSTSVSENVLGSDNQGTANSGIEQDDDNSIISEQSTELGENERERVRHIFQGWMNSGAAGHSQPNSRSGSEWLGENECERVRIIRDLVHTNVQQRSSGEGCESSSHSEQVRDGLAIVNPEICGRRTVRKICGRQTLIDLLVRAQYERRKELQGLFDQKPVSGFVHRNRIQALLRGRFLRTERSTLDSRPSSVAATELGLLRQKHTVSGLREGFLSKLDDSAPASASASASANNAEFDTLSSNGNISELETRDRGIAITEIQTMPDSESVANESRSQLGFLAHSELYTPVTQNEMNIRELYFETDRHQQEVLHDVGGVHIADEPVLNIESAELAEQEINTTNANEMPLSNENINYEGSHEIADEQYEMRSASFGQETVLDLTAGFDGNNIEQLDSQNALSSQWFDNTSVNGADRQDQMQESHEEDVLQEAIDSWLDMPSGDVGAFGRIHTFYFSDDDNAQSMEIRELFSRRHVSSLLRSGFRESLNQVLRSHVERQANALGDWESDNGSFYPNLAEQEVRRQNDDMALSQSEGADVDLFTQTSALSPEPETPWDFELQSENYLHQEWEVVNELRVDITRLQQRLNNMQSMLEQCMDLQIELQRSVRQEVSAALNHELSKENMIHDECQLDFVRRGICCLCHDSKIDSLLYRCGHMCTCSKCAERLVEGPRKCPMCRAPVLEAVRAYIIQ